MKKGDIVICNVYNVDSLKIYKLGLIPLVMKVVDSTESFITYDYIGKDKKIDRNYRVLWKEHVNKLYTIKQFLECCKHVKKQLWSL